MLLFVCRNTKIEITRTFFNPGGLISALVVIFGIVFVACAIKVHRNYHRTSGGNDSFGRVRYHRRRIARPWLAPSTSPYALRNQRLLGGSAGGLSNEATEEEEEVLINNDSLNRSRRRDDAEAFIQMLHSPSDSPMPRTMPALSGV